ANCMLACTATVKNKIIPNTGTAMTEMTGVAALGAHLLPPTTTKKATDAKFQEPGRENGFTQHFGTHRKLGCFHMTKGAQQEGLEASHGSASHTLPEGHGWK
ncbi:MAG: hypothetical protein ACKPKO_33295, partial [Candidatus Fonsibacter sp.]